MQRHAIASSTALLLPRFTSTLTSRGVGFATSLPRISNFKRSLTVRSFTITSVPQFLPPHMVPTAEDEAALSAQEKARSNPAADEVRGAEATKERLALPSPEEVAAAKLAEKEGSRLLDMSQGGGSISFDELGPMVVNENGTLSRIHNWGEMTAIERANTMRIIGKRNKQRIERIKKAQEEEAERERGAEKGKNAAKGEVQS